MAFSRPRAVSLILATAFVVCNLARAERKDRHRSQKKLIEKGWDLPTAPYVKAYIAEMEQTPPVSEHFVFSRGLAKLMAFGSSALPK